MCVDTVHAQIPRINLCYFKNNVILYFWILYTIINYLVFKQVNCSNYYYSNRCVGTRYVFYALEIKCIVCLPGTSKTIATNIFFCV